MKKIIALSTLLVSICIIATGSSVFASDIKDMKTMGFFFNHNTPKGSFSDEYDSAASGGVKLGYGITKTVGSEFAFSSFNFDGRDSKDNTSIDCLRANIYYRFDTTTNLYPLFTFGVGYYMPDYDSDSDLGINFGIALITDLIDINDMFSLNISGNYHRIFDSGEDTKFLEIRAGLDFNFF